MLKRRNQYCWPPITGAGSRCQNVSFALWTDSTGCGEARHPVAHALDSDPRGRSHQQHDMCCVHIFCSVFHSSTIFSWHWFCDLLRSYWCIRKRVPSFFVKRRSITSVNTLAAAISAAMAVHALNGTAILLSVIHCSLSTALITIQHPLLPSIFLLPSQ